MDLYFDGGEKDKYLVTEHLCQNSQCSKGLCVGTGDRDIGQEGRIPACGMLKSQ